MKKPEREYPDIEFLETDTETIESNMIALYEELVNKELVKQGKREKYKVYPASPGASFYCMVRRYYCTTKGPDKRNGEKECSPVCKRGVFRQPCRAFQGY